MAADTWVVLELGPKAENEDPDLIRRSIRHMIRDAEVFIPAAVTTVDEEKTYRYLVEGYAFIRRTHTDQVYLRLIGTRYVNAVLRNGRQLATISQKEIDKMRTQVRAESEQGIEVGDTVMVMSGPYRQITAEVHEDIPELKSVQLFISLRSKQALVTLPRNCLRLISKAPRALVEDRARVVLEWLDAIAPVLRWKGGLEKVLDSYDSWLVIHTLRGRVEALAEEIIALDGVERSPLPSWSPDLPRLLSDHRLVSGWITRREGLELLSRYSPDIRPLRKKHKEFARVHRLAARLTDMVSSVMSLASHVNPPEGLRDRAQQLSWLNGTLGQIESISETIKMIEQQMASEDVDMDTNPPSATGIIGKIDHMVIDGLNLAVRCCYAPGLSDLRDSKGRPTGMFYGFLNSITSFRRRFPEAALHVVWDGSSRRRKELFSGYKASRGSLPIQDWQVDWLRETLSLLGVGQYINPDEEADDVMATLVRTTFAGKRCAVYSTDRDLMQLVSPSVVWVTPPVGKAKETAYDIKAIESKWGVPPEHIVFLRAILGDTSDEIPGVGLPHKIATNLVNGYRTVDNLYRANLAGLTKLQYTKLRASEAVVRRNVELMTLRTDLPVTPMPVRKNQTAAEAWLREVDVKPDPILTAFFGENASGVTQ